MRMLVTGGAGFIGANFVHHTLTHHPQYEVSVLDALTYAGSRSNLDAVAGRVRLHEGNICDAALVDSLVRESDIVVHFAAESHVDNSLQSPEPFIQTNVMGTFVLLEAVRRHDKRFHHISTDEVFGDLALDATERFTETTAYDPSSPYAASKAGSDMLVRAWVRSFGIAATISNCANNYGPYQHPEKFIPRQITGLLGGQSPRLYGDGRNVREWTHVEDHNAAVHLVLDRGRVGETYLIGAGDEHSNKDIVRMLLELTGHPSDWFEQVPDRPGHDLRYSNDTTKIRRELGWSPQYDDLRKGLATTIEWYREHESWWSTLKVAAEARYRELGR